MSLSQSVNHASASAVTPPVITIQAGGTVSLNRKALQVSAVRGTTGKSRSFTITNSGAGNLSLAADAITLDGTDANQFAIVTGDLPRTIKPGKKATYTVALRPGSGAALDRVLTATLRIKPTNASAPTASVKLRGVATNGEGGTNEPSLARLLDLFGYSINDGDTSPDTTFLDIPGGATTDQISAPRFQKAGSGVVEITPLAQFVPRTSTAAGTFGTYQPGSPDTRDTLFTLNGADAQSVFPDVNGSTTFDPGTSAFGVWAEAPTFTDGIAPRRIYGEEALNTWEPDGTARNKVRVYPLEQDGQTIANAYVVAFEEYPPQNDQNDYVFLLRNVAPLKSTPEIGLIALGGQPDSTRLALNRIEVPNATTPNVVNDTASVRVINTGNKDLVISSIGFTADVSHDFQLVNAPATPVTLRRNATLDLTVRFVADAGDLRQATLAIASNDKDEPVKTVGVNGFWQSVSESDGQGVNQEPDLQEIFDTFGFRTKAVFSGQNINTQGGRVAVGDEVLADAWIKADAAKPVVAEEFAGYHTQGTSNGFGWYTAGSTEYNLLFSTRAEDGQRVLPRKANSADLAQATFNPAGAFGLRVDNEFSDDARNRQRSGDLGGHHWRFYPMRDADGDFVANTYLATMDFSSINFDYNDLVFIFRNMRPTDRTAAVDGLTAVGTTDGSVLDWGDVPDASGYRVYRSSKFAGTYERVTDSILTASSFNDVDAPRGKTRYYRVVAVDADGFESLPDAVTVYRPK